MNELWLASYLLLWVVVAGLSFIVMGLLRQLGLIQLRLGPDPGVLITQEGLERETLAPEFAALDVVNKQQVRLSDLKSQRVLAVFLTPTCIACRQLMPHLKEIARDSRRNVSVLTICHGSEVTCGEFAKVYRLDFPLLLDATNSIAEAYEVRMTPFGFLIGADGVIRLRGIVNSWPQLEALIEEEGTVSSKPWPSLSPAAMPSTHPENNAIRDLGIPKVNPQPTAESAATGTVGDAGERPWTP